jgi:hypothetical protein
MKTIITLTLILAVQFAQGQISIIKVPSSAECLKKVKTIFEKDYYKQKHGFSSANELKIENIAAAERWSMEAAVNKEKNPKDLYTLAYQVTTPKTKSGVFYEYKVEIEYKRAELKYGKLIYYNQWKDGFLSVIVSKIHGMKVPGEEDALQAYLKHFEAGQREVSKKSAFYAPIIQMNTPKLIDKYDFWDSGSSKMRNYKTGLTQSNYYKALFETHIRNVRYNREYSGIKSITHNKYIHQVQFILKDKVWEIDRVISVNYERIKDEYDYTRQDQDMHDTLYAAMTWDGYGLEDVYNKRTPILIPPNSERVWDERHEKMQEALMQLNGDPAHDKPLLAPFINPKNKGLLDKWVNSYAKLKENCIAPRIHTFRKKYSLQITEFILTVKRSGQKGKCKKTIDSRLRADLTWKIVNDQIYVDSIFSMDKLPLK